MDMLQAVIKPLIAGMPGYCTGFVSIVALLLWMMTEVREPASDMSSDHSAMQRLVADWSGEGCLSPSWTRNTPVCKWAGVTCAAGRVILFVWVDKKCFGTPDLTKLPAGIQQLGLNSNQFSGTPDLTNLPADMNILALGNNQFSGTPDLTKLPAGMKGLGLTNNQFTSTLDLSKVPAGMKVFQGNDQSGITDATKQSAGMQHTVGSHPIDDERLLQDDEDQYVDDF